MSLCGDPSPPTDFRFCSWMDTTPRGSMIAESCNSTHLHAILTSMVSAGFLRVKHSQTTSNIWTDAMSRWQSCRKFLFTGPTNHHCLQQVPFSHYSSLPLLHSPRNGILNNSMGNNEFFKGFHYLHTVAAIWLWCYWQISGLQAQYSSFGPPNRQLGPGLEGSVIFF